MSYGLTGRMVAYDSRDLWLEARRSVIGGSDVPIILGSNKFGSRFALWAAKVGIVTKEANEAMRWGSALEKAILAEWGREMGLTTQHFDNVHVQHPARPRWMYSLDGLTYHDGGDTDALVEVKNVGAWSAGDWEEGCPPYYLDQVQMGLACTGLSRSYVVALLGGNKCVYAIVPADPNWEEKNAPAIDDFLRRIDEEDEPEPDGTDDDEAAVWKRFDAAVGGDVAVMHPELIEVHEDLVNTNLTIKGMEKRKRALRQRLTEGMDGCDFATIPGVDGMYAHVSQETKGYSVAPGRKRFIQYRTKRKDGI